MKRKMSEGEETEENKVSENIPASSETSTIDPSYIIRAIIKLLPRRSQQQLEQANEKDVEMGLVLENILDPMQTDNEGNKENGQEEAPSGKEEETTEENEKIEAGCLLWDLSCSEEHSLFLYKHHVLPVIHSIILNSESHTHRLLEICIGIMANLCTVEELCERILRYELSSTYKPSTKPTSLLNSIESLLFQSNDPMVLSEIMRLLTVGICCARIFSQSRPFAALPALTSNNNNNNNNHSNTEQNAEAAPQKI